jgi:hypothetical protein
MHLVTRSAAATRKMLRKKRNLDPLVPLFSAAPRVGVGRVMSASPERCKGVLRWLRQS